MLKTSSHILGRPQLWLAPLFLTIFGLQSLLPALEPPPPRPAWWEYRPIRAVGAMASPPNDALTDTDAPGLPGTIWVMYINNGWGTLTPDGATWTDSNAFLQRTHLYGKFLLSKGHNPTGQTGLHITGQVSFSGANADYWIIQPGATYIYAGYFGRVAEDGQQHDMMRHREVIVGDPVNAATGSFLIDEPVISVKGAVNIVFSVDYNSLVYPASNSYTATLGDFAQTHGHNFQSSMWDLSTRTGKVWWGRNSWAQWWRETPTSDWQCLDKGFEGDKFTRYLDGSTTIYNARQDKTYAYSRYGRLLYVEQDGAFIDMIYNTSGVLTALEDRASGKRLTFTRNTNGNITQISDGNGAVATFTYGIPQQLTKITKPDGTELRFTYNGSWWDSVFITEIRDKNNTLVVKNNYQSTNPVPIVSQQDGRAAAANTFYTYTQGYTLPNHSTTVKNRLSNDTIMKFDPVSNLVGLKNPLGNETTFQYNSMSLRTQTTQPLGNVWSSTYNSARDLVANTDPLGNTTTIVPGIEGKPLSITDPLGNVRAFTYDGNGNPLTATDAEGNITTFVRNAQGQVTKTTLPEGGEEINAYSGGLLTSRTDPNGNTSTFEYWPSGLLKKITDAAGKITLFEFDKVGQPTQVTNHDGAFMTYAYNARGLLSGKTNALGGTVTLARDGNNNITSVTDELGHVTTNVFDAEDQIIQTMDATGVFATFAYDAAQRLTATGDSLGNLTTRVYDANDRLAKITDPSGVFTEYFYDARNLVTKRKDAVGNEWNLTYNAAGWLEETENPLGQSVFYAYDNNGRLGEVEDAGGLISSREFTPDGNVSTIINPRTKATTFEFDPMGLPTKETTHDGRSTLITYNSRNLPATVTDPKGQIGIITYDNQGRIASVADPAGTVSYARDALGRPLAITEGAATVAYVYDAAGRVTRYTDANGYIIDYTCDAANRLKTLSYGGKTVTYTYDADGRLSEVRDWANRTATYTYDSASRLTNTAYTDGSAEIRHYNSRGLVDVIEHTASGTTFWKQTLSYDAIGRISTDAVETSGTTTVHTYTYDASGRVISANFPSTATWSATWDGATNPTSVTTTSNPTNAPLLPVGTFGLTYNGDNVAQTFNSDLLLYDDNGNLTYGPLGSAPPFVAYSYDARNRLTDVSTTSYTYDSENRRTSRTESGTDTTTYVWDPVGERVLFTVDGSGHHRYYVHGIGLAWSVSEDAPSVEQTETHHYDVRGSTVGITDTTGAVQGTVSYGVFGEILSKGASVTTPFLFVGKWNVQTDPNGLVYMRSRYYHPGLRQFITPDKLRGTIADGRTLNRYAYCNGDPVNQIDPLGTSSFWVGALDKLQMSLDVAGFAPALGAVPDLLNAGIHLLRGNYLEAGMSSLAAIPLLGDAAHGLFLAGKGIKAVSSAEDAVAIVTVASKHVDDLPPPKWIDVGAAKVDASAGGAYREVRGVAGNEAHHMPADSVSPFSRDSGPAVSMEIAEHRQTASWGSSKEAKAYRAQQKKLIDEGKFQDAQQMDIDDLRLKFGEKYDPAIQRMSEYTDTLIK